MPPVKQVQSLYFQCLNCVFENLYETLTSGVSPQNFERMRKYYVSNLHGGIREHILKLAVLKDRNRIKFLLQLINLLADPSISYLCPISGPGFLLPDHYSTLISHLTKRDCIGLKALYIRVLYERPEAKTEDPVIRTNVNMFHSLLSKGLTKNLTVLVLGRCCDNEILRIIGRQCTNLTKLDIVASWAVNDNGFKYLCLKNPNSVQDISEGESHSPQLIEQLMKIKANRLNTCCFTLTDIRIQETNTTDMTVLMLLIFMKNLKTLGGFIYFRSVGDNIVFLSRLAYGKLKLNFTELYDTHLTDSKLRELSVVVPNLKAVYTRSLYVQPLLCHFKKLASITIDFDYQPYEDNFFSFLSITGNQLKQITLIDRNGFTDMLRILKLCPNLEEINGSVTIYDTHREIVVPNLKKANLKVMKADTVPWLLMNAPNLEYLEVDAICPFGYTGMEFPEFDNRYLKKILSRRPACFDSLKYFIVHASYPRIFNKKTVLSFILRCKKLKLIGDLATWSVHQKHANFIRSQLKRRNLDVNVLFAEKCKPDITMQSIEEFNTM